MKAVNILADFFSGTYQYTSYLCAHCKIIPNEELCMLHQQNSCSEPPGWMLNRNNGSDPGPLPFCVSVKPHSCHCWAVLVLTLC